MHDFGFVIYAAFRVYALFYHKSRAPENFGGAEAWEKIVLPKWTKFHLKVVFVGFMVPTLQHSKSSIDMLLSNFCVTISLVQGSSLNWRVLDCNALAATLFLLVITIIFRNRFRSCCYIKVVFANIIAPIIPVYIFWLNRAIFTYFVDSLQLYEPK